MLVDNPFGNRKAKADPFGNSPRFICPVETVKDMRHFVLVHPNPGIRDTDAHLVLIEYSIH
ncbi:hypothetical protein D3C74_503230 [compost metagenome]